MLIILRLLTESAFDTSFHVVSIIRHHQPQFIDQVTQPDLPTPKTLRSVCSVLRFTQPPSARARARSTLVSGLRSNERNFNKYCTPSSKIDKIMSELFATQEVLHSPCFNNSNNGTLTQPARCQRFVPQERFRFLDAFLKEII